MTEKSNPNPKSGADPSGGGSPEPSSLDRLADFTRRIIAVPKSELPTGPKQGESKARAPKEPRK